DPLRAEPGGLARLEQPGPGVAVLVGGARGPAEGDVAGDEHRAHLDGAGEALDVPAELAEHELLVPAVGRVTVPEVDVGDVDPAEERPVHASPSVSPLTLGALFPPMRP